MKKIKTIYPVILLTLLLLVSCKSKKNMVATLPRPVLNSDSIYPDTANAIAGLFSPDHSQIKRVLALLKKMREDIDVQIADEKEKQEQLAVETEL